MIARCTVFFLLIVGALQAQTTSGQDTIIHDGAIWKYLDDGSNQGTAWFQPNFPDSLWSLGAAELGYGDGDESTLISYGSSSSNKHITSYFRKTFNVDTPSKYNNFSIDIIRDDGAVVYLNGTKVWQDNMPTTFNYLTTSNIGIGGNDESQWISAVIGDSLIDTVNVIAVEIHQASASSSDLSFDLRLIGGVNDAPNADSMTVSVVKNSSVDFYLSATDDDGDEISYTVGNANNGTTSIYGSIVTYEPQVNFNGSETFTYTASDGALQTTGYITVSVVDSILEDTLLVNTQKDVLKYFWEHTHPVSRLTKERIHADNLNLHKNMVTSGGSGFGFLNVLMAIENDFIERDTGIAHLETALAFLETADRFHGAWAHWMNGNTGDAWAFSTQDDGGDLVETAFLVEGLICIREYFKNGTPREQQLAALADTLWKGVEWDWYTQGEDELYWHWSPNYGWAINLKISGYNEALITYILAASSPTYTIDADVYHEGWAAVGPYFPDGWIETTAQKFGLPIYLKHGGANGSVGPMFLSHYSNLVLDPRGLKDNYADNYFDVVKNHTSIIYQHCTTNPNNYEGYGHDVWGLTASYSYDTTKTSLTGYHVHQIDDDLGVITPTAALSSLPYTPQKSIQVLRYLYERSNGDYLSLAGPMDAFSIHHLWKTDRHLAIDQGTIGPMIENHKTQFFWNLFMNAPDIRAGLLKLGFTSSTHNLYAPDSTSSYDSIVACGSYTWINGVTYTSSTSTPVDTLISSTGQDSIVILNLTINSPTSGTETVAACGSYLWNGTTYTTTGTYTSTLTGANGCDSVATLNLTINSPTSGTETVAACGSYTWIDGLTYTASNNTATYTLTNVSGCDSLVTLDLTIESIDSTVTLSGHTIYAISGYDSYQWYECTANGFVSMNNETNDSINITANGDYAVVINNSNCSDTSVCVTVNNIGFEENNQVLFKLFPNPTEGMVQVERGNSASPISTYQLQIVDSQGKIIQKSNVNFQDGFIVINLEDYPAGVYQLSLINEHEVFHDQVSIVK